MPIKAVLITAFVLTMVDMMMGIGAAVKQGQKVTSKGMGRTLLKIFVYELALMMGFLSEKYLLDGSVPVTKLLGGLIGATELISILENADIMSGNSLFSKIIALLQSQSNKNPPNDEPPGAA